MDYGYFRNNVTKSKLLTIRNWDPLEKEIKIKLGEESVEKFKMNCSYELLGPFPYYDMSWKKVDGTLILYLAGNHYITLNITIFPCKNATSG